METGQFVSQIQAKSKNGVNCSSLVYASLLGYSGHTDWTGGCVYSYAIPLKPDTG